MACNGDCSNCNSKEKAAEDCRLKSVMQNIKHKIVVMSGKGGVGKSTVGVNLAVSPSVISYVIHLPSLNMAIWLSSVHLHMRLAGTSF